MTRARSALAAESNFVSALLDATSAFVLTIDAEGRIVRCNAACEAIAGRPRSEIEGRFVWESIDMPREHALCTIADCWQAGGARSFEERLPMADGSEIIVAWSTAGVRDPAGNLSCLVATGQDITSHRHAAQTLQKAYDLEHRIATTLQESLLRPIPEIAGLALGVAYRPANEAERVGGDFYDVYQIAPNKVITVVGDVSGKGVQAAGLTETVRSTLRALLYMELAPEDALTRAGQVLFDQTQPDQFAAVGIAVVDLSTNDFRYASAGHPPPIVRGEEAARFLDVPQGVPLGSYPYRYQHASMRLEPPECLVLYTDGLGDARRGKAFFWDGLLAAACKQALEPRAIVHGLLEEAAAFSHVALADDIAIVALQLPA